MRFRSNVLLNLYVDSNKTQLLLRGMDSKKEKKKEQHTSLRAQDSLPVETLLLGFQMQTQPSEQVKLQLVPQTAQRG